MLRRERVMRQHNNSEREPAGFACNSHSDNARKSVENNCVISLSFRPFLSLYIAIKEKEKDK